MGLRHAEHAVCSSITVRAIFAISWPTCVHLRNCCAEGTSQYTTCDNLLNTSGGDWPKSSLFEIADAGVALNKLVIGKPAQAAGDANNGFIEPATLAGCLSQAKAKGWGAFLSTSVPL